MEREKERRMERAHERGPRKEGGEDGRGVLERERERRPQDLPRAADAITDPHFFLFRLDALGAEVQPGLLRLGRV